MTILQHYTNEFRCGRDILPSDSQALFEALISDQDESLLADLLNAWNTKGATEDELFELATIMRARMKRINSKHSKIVDIVGTGGSDAKTFNVSTAAAFVIAGAGVAIAKHGNRAATSNSGSADVLSLLGVNIDIDSHASERCLNEIGLCFMFAPRFHSLSPALANARRSINRPTVFNNLGPLCNPASTPHQVIGVWKRDLVRITANVLARLGTEKSWIVHSHIGLDEIGLTGKTYVAEINGVDVKQFEIDASSFGVTRTDGMLPLRCSAKESSKLIRQILSNKLSGSDPEKLVNINAAAAIFVTGNAADLTTAYSIAENSIRSGAANEKLTALAAETNK
jgi:anthranilate phosphoribosyltransferase